MSDLIERLEKIAEASKRAFTDVSEACAEAAARIKELEADLKQHQELNAAEHAFMLEAYARRDAIEAETTAKIIAMLDESKTYPEFEKKLRALAKPKTE